MATTGLFPRGDKLYAGTGARGFLVVLAVHGKSLAEDREIDLYPG
jgi:hypothetical protein